MSVSFLTMHPTGSLLFWTAAIILFCSPRGVDGFFFPSTANVRSAPSPTSTCSPSTRTFPLFALEKPPKDDVATSQPFFMANTKDNPTSASTSATEELPSKGDSIKSDAQWEILGAIWDVAGDIARQIFFAMRRSAAGALTASLPEEEREELLERTLGKERVAQAKSKLGGSGNSDDDDGYAASMSVQEQQAAATVKEVQRDPEQWQKEKAAIYKQAEQAANDRMEMELAIQRQRLEQEKKQLLQEQQAAQQHLTSEKQSLEQQWQAEMVKQKEESNAQQQMEQQESAAAVQEQQVKLAAMEEALKEKETLAEQYRAKMVELAQALELASSGAPITTATTTKEEVKPRIHTARYTAEEYRALTDEEKEQVRVLREKEGFPPVDSSTTTTMESSESNDIHPILGPVIQDLGYKRIHLLSAGKLGTIPIWKKQRIYRHERAKAMVEDKWKTMPLGFPGVICLHEDKDGKLSIVDGQHRVGMMMLLRDKQRKVLEEQEDGKDEQPSNIDFDRILVEVYPHHEAYEDGNDDDKHAQDLFLEINKAEPIKLVDMPGVAPAKDRKILTAAVDELYEKYPEMFSPSQRCRKPNVNVDNLRNQLFGADVMKKHKLTTPKKLIEWVLEQNDMLEDKYENSEEAREAIGPKVWKKASANKFYLGLESTWLYN